MITIIHPSKLLHAQSSGATATPDFFIEAEIDNPNPYLGQQVTYTVRRYQATEFPGLPYFEDHPFTGFWDIPLIQRPAYTTTIAGREYIVRPTHIAIFPTLPGPNTIAPTKLIIPGGGSKADTILESQPIEVMVKPLPDGAPPDFAGAVGQFNLSTHFLKPETNIDASLSLIVNISGTGNIEIVNQPIFPNVTTWRLFKSQATTDVPLATDKVTGSRQFEWTVVANQTGQQEFPAVVLSYFDPETSRYQTVRTDPLPVNILPVEQVASPTALPAAVDEAPPSPVMLIADINPLKAVPASLGKANTLMSRPLLWWGCAVLPLLAIGTVLGLKQWRKSRAAAAPQIRRQRAKRKAQSVLALAKDPTTDPYTTVQQALTGYLSDQLDQSLVGLTSAQLIDQLHNLGLPEHLQQQVQNILNQIDAGRFAPIAHDPPSRQKLIAEATTVINQLETFFKKRR